MQRVELRSLKHKLYHYFEQRSEEILVRHDDTTLEARVGECFSQDHKIGLIVSVSDRVRLTRRSKETWYVRGDLQKQKHANTPSATLIRASSYHEVRVRSLNGLRYGRLFILHVSFAQMGRVPTDAARADR